MYDHDGTEFTPGWHWGRTISVALFEPSRYALRFDGSASGNIYKLQTNTNFVAEFGVQFDSLHCK